MREEECQPKLVFFLLSRKTEFSVTFFLYAIFIYRKEKRRRVVGDPTHTNPWGR